MRQKYYLALVQNIITVYLVWLFLYKQGNFFYIATKIILNTDEDITITKPIKDKTMTQKEYDVFLADFSKNRMKYTNGLK